MRALVVQHDAAEGLGLFQEILTQKGWDLDIRHMQTPGITLPENLEDYQAFIILGGPMGAYEEKIYPYLYQVQQLILKAGLDSIPTLGICLGAQLIARALGADVGPNSVKEIGWYSVDLTPAGKKESIFKGFPFEFSVFQWHGDTFALPEEAVLLVTGKSCINQAFIYGKTILALQFHPEVSLAMIEHWTEIYAIELNDFAGPRAAEKLNMDTEIQVSNNIKGWNEMLVKRIEIFLRGEKIE
jgi:GMP synthase-like glutamine amidotransferase